MKWSEMTPEQRNVLVAEKIMGWTEQPCDLDLHDGKELTVYDSGDACCPRCGVYEHINSFEHGIIPPPRYSESMDAAWLVLQHMVKQYCVDLPAQNEVWDRFCEANFEGYIESKNAYRWTASWTPERLCIAALIAKGIEVEL